MQTGTTTSLGQESVAHILSDLGHSVRQEVWIEELGLTVDILVSGHPQPIIVEVDGPSHFITCVHTNTRTPNGPTLLRDRIVLQSGKFVLLKIPFYEWDSLNHGSRTIYIQTHLS
jgi:hypothetical protein